MRLLLDENLPRRLKRHLAPHQVRTVQEMGWSGIKNGRLLRLAEQDFDVLITIDSNMVYQQHVPAFALGLMVLHAPSNRLVDLTGMTAEILAQVEKAGPGQVVHVGDWGTHG
jgi:hypothetical protein